MYVVCCVWEKKRVKNNQHIQFKVISTFCLVIETEICIQTYRVSILNVKPVFWTYTEAYCLSTISQACFEGPTGVPLVLWTNTLSIYRGVLFMLETTAHTHTAMYSCTTWSIHTTPSSAYDPQCASARTGLATQWRLPDVLTSWVSSKKTHELNRDKVNI